MIILFEAYAGFKSDRDQVIQWGCPSRSSSIRKEAENSRWNLLSTFSRVPYLFASHLDTRLDDLKLRAWDQILAGRYEWATVSRRFEDLDRFFVNVVVPIRELVKEDRISVEEIEWTYNGARYVEVVRVLIIH